MVKWYPVKASFSQVIDTRPIPSLDINPTLTRRTWGTHRCRNVIKYTSKRHPTHRFATLNRYLFRAFVLLGNASKQSLGNATVLLCVWVTVLILNVHNYKTVVFHNCLAVLVWLFIFAKKLKESALILKEREKTLHRTAKCRTNTILKTSPSQHCYRVYDQLYAVWYGSIGTPPLLRPGWPYESLSTWCNL